MYSLRRIIPDSGVETNTFLGEEYRIIKKKAENFTAILECQDGLNPKEKESVYAFVYAPESEKTIPLLTNYWNFIVTERGNTYAKL